MSGDLTLDEILESLARGRLPWEDGWDVDFSAFNDRFTLHDSSWIGIYSDVGKTDEVVLAFEWDAHWLPEPLRTECMTDAAATQGVGNPFLFVRLPGIHDVQLGVYEQTGGGPPISHVEWSVEKDVNVWVIVDVFGEKVRLEFIGCSVFLALGRNDGRVLGLAASGRIQ